MFWLHALILGALQGLTEFLPVSSSAHLKLVKMWFGVEGGEGQVVFDLACHLGTLCAVLYFLRRDIAHLVRVEQKKLWLFFVALLPLIPCYFLLKPARDWASQTNLLGVALMVTGAILFLGQKWRVKVSEGKKRDALWIGAMQSVALIPGISRSASTISCARILGWEPREAVRFSFLLAIPTIIGGNCLELLKLAITAHPVLSEISFSSCLIGFLSSLCVGAAVVGVAVRFLEKGNLMPFAWYCLALGAIATLIYA
jgi:undecaprenyl-diphosphatase